MGGRKHKNAVKKCKEKSVTDIRNYRQYIIVCASAMLINYLLVALLWDDCNQASFHKNAQSAIKRAQSPECKQKLKDIACLGDAAFPSSIQPTCSFYDQINYLGCFQDAHQSRHLNGSKTRLKNTMTPYDCVTYCHEKGYALAGVEFGVECYCGDSIEDRMRISEGRCNMTCSGDSSKRCGGSLALNVYETKLDRQLNLTRTSAADGNNKIRIAYLLIFHGRAVRQHMRLLKRLYNENDFFYIHIDSRSDFLYGHLKALDNGDNVIVTDQRFATIWGGASRVKMMTNAMREMFDHQWNFDFLIDLSGTDYILKKPSELRKYLAQHQGMNFIWSTKAPNDKFLSENSMINTFVECEAHMYLLGPRTLPEGTQFDGGSDWYALSRNFVEYIALSEDPLLKDLYSIYDHSLMAAESFFITTVKSSHFCSTLINNNFRLINWLPNKGGCHCKRSSVDWCGCSPVAFNMKNWKKINGTRKIEAMFFARKFDATMNVAVLNGIDQFVLGQELPNKFWLNVWHRGYDSPNNAIYNLGHLLIGDSNEEKMNNLQEMTLYYKNDTQNSLLVLFNNGVVEQEYQFLTYTSKLTTSGDLISMGTNFDHTEKVFRQDLPIFDSKPTFLVKHLRNSTRDVHQGSVLWISPDGNVVSAVRHFNINMTKPVQLVGLGKSDGPEHHLLNNGLWTVVYFDFLQQVHHLDFLIVGHPEHQPDIPILLNNYENNVVDSIIAMKPSVESWLESTFAQQETCVVQDTCEFTDWSSKSHDLFASIELNAVNVLQSNMDPFAK